MVNKNVSDYLNEKLNENEIASVPSSIPNMGSFVNGEIADNVGDSTIAKNGSDLNGIFKKKKRKNKE